MYKHNIITGYSKRYEGIRALREKLTGRLRLSGQGRLLMWHINRQKREEASTRKTFQMPWAENTKPKMRTAGTKNQQKVSVNGV